MATMIPENVEEFKTEGERQFYKFLEVVAKPDSRHITWYTPNIEGKEPDFILFSQNVGLIIFEVNSGFRSAIKSNLAKIPFSSLAITFTILLTRSKKTAN